MENEIDKLIELCKASVQIYIYGAGRNAGILFSALKERGVSVGGFVVSDMKDNPETLFDLPVYPVIEFSTPPHSQVLVSIVKEGKSYKEVFDCLVRNRVHNTFFISRKIIWELTKQSEEPLPMQIQDIFQNSVYSLGIEVPVEKGHSILSMTDMNGEVCHWRFRDKMIYEQNIRSISELFPEKTPLTEFEELYSKYICLRFLKPISDSKTKKCIIYMAKSHADKEKGINPILPEWVLPLQVGAALADYRVCGLMDNMGDNISEKNGTYSEGTGLYWMWKNAPRTEYIGLCHYRRHFKMSEQELVNLMNADIDVLVTSPTFVNISVGGFLSTIIPQTDFTVMLEVISRVCPEYLPTAHKFLDARFYPPCNLSIMKWELFQKYAEYVFSVTFEIERFYEELGFIRQDRYMGYIIECLLGIFLMHHKESLKIAYTDMEFYE